MGDGFFDFDELEAQLPFEGKCHHVKRWESLFSPLNTTTTTVTAQPILGGASFCGNLSAGLRVQLFGLSRGMLKLDVVITQVRPIPDSTGFIMCVSTAGSAAEFGHGNSTWCSGLAIGGIYGWQCQIQSHKLLHLSSFVSILLALGGNTVQMPRIELCFQGL